MAEVEKEIGRFLIAVTLLQNESGKIRTRVINRNINLIPEVLISNIRMLTRMLEDEYYHDFKDNVTSIKGNPDE